ncbi:MAG: hypothetical protein A2401_02680 [Candidatus Staskawiczbacteria bacterium RIFOXYC1_FULL_38_18]|uniref:Uncharacterized protein n=1 Tax=Candidatus Staskawiczbacteria bacterium RIFOXYC1_FULL_38_18 TaxID=1802229 RepID=A0A1G2JB09_9BACT|nr:MAG: hypothetical protein A2401_02680 [Candidatus Staskawiczbacteria bacterium RIFOXYC1_FULL_38_18]
MADLGENILNNQGISPESEPVNEQSEKEKVEDAKDFLVEWIKEIWVKEIKDAEAIEEATKKEEEERKLVNYPDLPENFEVATGKILATEVKQVVEASAKAKGLKHLKASEIKNNEKFSAKLDEAIEKRANEVLENEYEQMPAGKYKTFEDFEKAVEGKIDELIKGGIKIDKAIFCDLMNEGYDMLEKSEVKKSKKGKGTSLVVKKGKKQVSLSRKKIDEIKKDIEKGELNQIISEGKDAWRQEKTEAVKQVIKTEVEKISQERAKEPIIDLPASEEEIKNLSEDNDSGSVEGAPQVEEKLVAEIVKDMGGVYSGEFAPVYYIYSHAYSQAAHENNFFGEIECQNEKGKIYNINSLYEEIKDTILSEERYALDGLDRRLQEKAKGRLKILKKTLEDLDALKAIAEQEYTKKTETESNPALFQRWHREEQAEEEKKRGAKKPESSVETDDEFLRAPATEESLDLGEDDVLSFRRQELYDKYLSGDLVIENEELYNKIKNRRDALLESDELMFSSKALEQAIAEEILDETVTPEDVPEETKSPETAEQPEFDESWDNWLAEIMNSDVVRDLGIKTVSELAKKVESGEINLKQSPEVMARIPRFFELKIASEEEVEVGMQKYEEEKKELRKQRPWWRKLLGLKPKFKEHKYL